MRNTLLSTLALVALTAGTALFAADAPEAKPAPKIAVIRLEEVLRASKLYAAGMEKWKKEQAEATAALKGIDEQLQKLDGQLQVLKPDNANYAGIQEEFEVLKLKKDITYKKIRAELERRQVALVKSVFANAKTKLAQFCKERAIMIVHLAPDLELNAPGFSDIQLELGLKSVLYYDPAMDITEAFVPYLNAADAAAAAATDKAPVAAPAPAPKPAADVKP